MAARFSEGVVVWVRVDAQPWRPARVISSSEFPEPIPPPSAKGIQIPVQLFGSAKFALISSLSSIALFWEKSSDRLKSRSIQDCLSELFDFMQENSDRYSDDIEILETYLSHKCLSTGRPLPAREEATTIAARKSHRLTEKAEHDLDNLASLSFSSGSEEGSDSDYQPTEESESGQEFDFGPSALGVDPQAQTCEVVGCQEEVWAACTFPDCQILLCYDHDHADLPCETGHQYPEQVQAGTGDPEQGEKRPKTAEERRQKQEMKHPIKPPGCSEKCMQKCCENFAEEKRKEIHEQFWSLSYNERKQWLWSHVKVKRTQSQGTAQLKKRYVNCEFKNAIGDSTPVCRPFFLTTLGYGKTCNQVLRTLYETTAIGGPTTPKDRRGANQPTSKCDEESITAHIDSFHPAIHHYRRAHAPHRKYLPSDITITLMHKDYNESHEPVSYPTYRKFVQQKKISFAVLGNEECEQCVAAELHRKEKHNSETDDACEVCAKHNRHMQSATEARESYKRDADENLCPDKVIVSADLQKVIMLPRIPGSKTVLFTNRIVAFNETFAHLGSEKDKKLKRRHLLVLWNESVRGRKAEDIASAFWAFLSKNRDAKEIIIWLDNCAGQNKNWLLYTMLLTAINLLVSAQSITLKYLQPGHTFMSADSVHHGIELQMKKDKNIYDWQDFLRMAEASNSQRVDLVEMKISDFLLWHDGTSKAKVARTQPRLYLRDLAVVQFRKGNRNMYFKTSHLETNFHECDILQSKLAFDYPLPQPSARGITAAKKKQILKNLCPLMPENRRKFWEDLAVNDVPDLVQSDDN